MVRIHLVPSGHCWTMFILPKDLHVKMFAWHCVQELDQVVVQKKKTQNKTKLQTL